jgi:hypothetical protein
MVLHRDPSEILNFARKVRGKRKKEFQVEDKNFYR